MTTPTLPQAAQMAEDTLAALWDRHAGGKLNIDSACPAFIDRAQKTITALREALAAPEPEPVALESVHLTRDTRGMCVVRVNGRVAIRDNGDIIDHMATLEWFAAPPAAPQPEPVAWYLPSPDDDDSIFRDHRTVVACTGNKWEGFLPLYAAPPAAPADDHATPSGGQEAGPQEDRIEAAYWRFDARHKGYSQWKTAPMSERDAFKAEMRNALEAEKVRAEMRLVARGWRRPDAPAAPAPAAPVPAGWVMVPREPTQAMRKAAADAWLDCDSKLILNKAAAAIRAAIAASPAAPVVRDLQQGVLDQECNYMAPMGRVCNKCGRIHRGITGGKL